MGKSGVKGSVIAGNSGGSMSFSPRKSQQLIGAPWLLLPRPPIKITGKVETLNETVKRIADSSGAILPAALRATELVSFEVLQSGEVEIELADGTKCIIVTHRHSGAYKFSAGVTAEDFISLVGRFAVLPIGARPEGRRFIRRNAIAADGTRCVRFTEAGRDV